MATNMTRPYSAFTFGTLFICESYFSSVTSKGVFFRDNYNDRINPLRHSFTLLILQIGITTLILSLFRRILKPLKQPRFVAEILTGIVIGPSMLHVFRKQELYESFINPKQLNIMNVLEVVSFATMSFIIGIRTDVGVIKSSGKLSWTIGVLNLALPLALTLTVIKFYKPIGIYSQTYYEWSSILVSSISFPVILILLDDLRLLNSEIGRRALSSALISNVCGSLFMIYRAYTLFASYNKFNSFDYFKTEIPRILIVLFIIFILRPLSFKIIKRIPEGRGISQWHFLTVFTAFLVIIYSCEILGYTGHFGALVLGLAIQSGPPLGSGVVKKLEIIVNSVLFPTCIITAGSFVNVFAIKSPQMFSQVEGIIALAVFGKLVAAVVPSLICKIPYKDSFTFGLILSNQGLWDVLLLENALRRTMIDQETYTILVLMILLYAGISTPLISYLYDPSKRYINYRRRTIQHSINEDEFRILLCIHEEEQVFSLMNILKTSNPTRRRPIGAFILDLLELIGRNQPIFINHQLHSRPYSEVSTRTERIINAFRHYENQADIGAIKHQFYTTIAPYNTMHDDICTLALDKSASLLIIPFHKSGSLAMKNITRNVLEKAPCSVGILIDKKIISHWRSTTVDGPALNICVVFVGGPDSREALAYAMRMVQNSRVKLTVVTLTTENEMNDDFSEMKLDMKLLNDLRILNDGNPRNEVRQMVVSDGTETLQTLLSIDDQFDFILVGRRLKGHSDLVSGLSDWSYEEELGILGDILASSDMKCNASVLVLQQQVTVEDLMKKKVH